MVTKKWRCLARAVLLVLLLALAGTRTHAATAPPVHADHAMVVSASPRASKAGVAILRKGGNAFDAAAAVGFVLAVTWPPAGNLGGGGFMVAQPARGGVITLDFRETAPAAAYRDLYLDEKGEVVPHLSLWSPLASGVPGSVDGLLTLWREHGSGEISRKALLAPAIALARRGFLLSNALAHALNAGADRFRNDPAAAIKFIRSDGRPWREGDRLVQRNLARTLHRIADQDRDGFYAGPTADLIAQQQIRRGGLITRRDLAQYRSIYRPPVVGTFHDYQIFSMGPPSSGGVLLVQMLNMLDDRPLDELGWASSAYVHLLTEVQRRAFADRAEHLGDPGFWPVPTEALIDKTYARTRAASISMTQATPSAEVFAGLTPGRESPETTHYSVVDALGNAVAITTTLNAAFGSGIVVAGAGFLMNNEMDDFASKPGAPNLYGVIGADANAIQPGKRMLSSMTPTIVKRGGRTVMVLGSPGGPTIITTTLQVFLNVAVHGMNIREAVSAPRHHSQWLPDRIVYERRALSRDVEERLTRMGHTLTRLDTALGAANCILITEEGLYGAPDPRSQAAAIGY